VRVAELAVKIGASVAEVPGISQEVVVIVLKVD